MKPHILIIFQLFFVLITTQKSNTNTIITAFSEKNGSICSNCDAIVTTLILLRKNGESDVKMREKFKELCMEKLRLKGEICESYSQIETDTFLYIIDNKNNLRGGEICAIYLQDKGCTWPYSKKWMIDIPQIPQNLTKPIEHKQKQNGNNEQLERIVQITDVHYDPLYKPGTNADCGSPLCCEKESGIPNNPDNSAGLYGDFRSCDMSRNSLIDLMKEIKRSQKKIDYVYFTGDIVAHINWKTSRQTNLETIEEFYDILHSYLGDIPVFPILGNHEAHPCNFYAPLDVESEQISSRWLFAAVSRIWSKWLPKYALETIELGGFYTVLVRPGFRIIALNSNVCFTENAWLFYNDEDEYGQLKWLVEILLLAEEHHEKVHILSHVPPGDMKCHRQWMLNFQRIVQRFSKTITAQFNGHTHNDEFRLFRNSNNSDQVINVAFNGGSFTTFTGLNPDYRVYEVDPKNLMVSDYHHFTFNLTLANSAGSSGPSWYKLYSFKSAYNLEDLSYESLNSLNKKLYVDQELAQKYIRFYVRDSEHSFVNGCNQTCTKSQICHISAIDMDSSLKCGVFNPN